MTSATPPPVAARALWRRYRAPLVAAIPSGMLSGAIAGLAFSINTVDATPQDRIPALLAYAGLGAGFALVACIGAVLAVLVERSRSTATTTTPFWHIAGGAGAAVSLGVLLIGTISAASTSSWQWYSIYAVIAVVTGLLAAVPQAPLGAPRRRSRSDPCIWGCPRSRVRQSC